VGALNGRERWTAVARGDEPADLAIVGGQVLSVFTGEIFQADVAIVDGHVVGLGSYGGRETIDATGKYLIPGLIDGHCHIESSKLNVDEFARVIVAHGTTAAVVDPHELANVLGVRGIEYVLEAGEGLPLRLFVTLPSCVPASDFESPHTALGAEELAELAGHKRVVGLAEMMNYPAAAAGRVDVLAKMALTGFRHIDGHAPGLSGAELCAYIASGPSSDHECTTVEEALEKRRLGMWVMIREASMIRNLTDLLPLIKRHGTDNTMFVTDDREAGTLLDEGSVNSMLRKAVANGLSPADAVKLATLNPARYHDLQELGAVAPGYRADILILPDLVSFNPDMVLVDGTVVARDGETLPCPSVAVPTDVTGTVHIQPVKQEDFRRETTGAESIRIVTLIRDQVVTRATVGAAFVRDGALEADPASDLAKLAVVERHHASGRIGVGFVRGFGLQHGAFASTVAHDAHNIVIVGVNDDDMALCANRLAEIGGGLIVAADGGVRGEMSLEIAGLMSTRPAAEVVTEIARLEAELANLGVTPATPFMYLSFLALSVIPEMRVTDQGVIDVLSFSHVPLEVA